MPNFVSQWAGPGGGGEATYVGKADSLFGEVFGWLVIAGGEFSGRVPVQLPGLAGVCFQFDVSSHMICRVEYASMIQGTALLYVSYKSLNRQRYRLWRPAVSQVVVNHFGGGLGRTARKKKGPSPTHNFFVIGIIVRQLYVCWRKLHSDYRIIQRMALRTRLPSPSPPPPSQFLRRPLAVRSAFRLVGNS